MKGMIVKFPTTSHVQTFEERKIAFEREILGQRCPVIHLATKVALAALTDVIYADLRRGRTDQGISGDR